MSILRDSYKRVHLIGHREHPEHRSLCGMVDSRWSWAEPHLTRDLGAVTCGRCRYLQTLRSGTLFEQGAGI